jgi:hypothetical protein
MIRKGSNRWRVVKWLKPYRGGSPGTAKVIPEGRQRFESDWRAIEPKTGRSVFVEVKSREDKLLHSDLKEHQRALLDKHRENGGLSLVVWVSFAGVHVLEWPVEGFEEGTSLSVDRARDLELLP